MLLAVLVAAAWIVYWLIRFAVSLGNEPSPIRLKWFYSTENERFTWRNKFFDEHPFLFAVATRSGMPFFAAMVAVSISVTGLVLWKAELRSRDLWIFLIPLVLIHGAVITLLREMVTQAIRYPVNHTVQIDLKKHTVYTKGIGILGGSLETKQRFTEITGISHHTFKSRYGAVLAHRLYLICGEHRLMLFNILSNDDYDAIRRQIDQFCEPSLNEIEQHADRWS